MRIGVRHIVVLGMVLRVAWALLVPVEPVSDGAAYDAQARTIVEHGVYGWTADSPSAYWAVGTSALAAGTYMLLGETYWGIVGLNLLASLALMLLSWQVAQWYFGARAAFWTVVVLAVWPNLIFFTSILSSELFFMALTMGGLFFWARPVGSFWVNLLLCGLIWGAACYVRPVIVLFPAAMLIAALSQGLRATGVAAIKAAVAIVLIVITVSPWTMRNAEVMGKAYLVSSNFGTNLWMGNNPLSDGGYTPLPPEIEGMSERQREEYLGAQAKAYIAQDPARFAATVGWRVVDLHARETIGVVWNEAALRNLFGTGGVFVAKLVASAYWMVMVVAALGALIVLMRTQRLGALFHPVFGGWAYFTAVHAIVVSGDRYHMPSVPFIALLAGVFLAWSVAHFNKKEIEPA